MARSRTPPRTNKRVSNTNNDYTLFNLILILLLFFIVHTLLIHYSIGLENWGKIIDKNEIFELDDF